MTSISINEELAAQIHNLADSKQMPLDELISRLIHQGQLTSAQDEFDRSLSTLVFASSEPLPKNFSRSDIYAMGD